VEMNENTPATTSLAYQQMQAKWNKVQTVLDGTDAMRQAGTAYLPQHEGESDKAYKERLQRATLLNMTRITLETLVGMPFGEPILFTEVPGQVESLLDNVDLVGSDVHVFCREWFSDGVAKAYSHVFVDYPRTSSTREDGAPRTLADDAAEGVRPYWIHIRPEELLFADADMVDGREVLREVRILECVTERDGFAEVPVQQIKQVVADPAGCQVTLWRPDPEQRKKDKIDWIKVDEYTMTMPAIPLVTFYAHRTGFQLGVPPLGDLADMNIAHWQSTSDQRSVLTTARFPILALSGGVDKSKKLTVGPNQWLWSPDPNGKFYYVEHSGAAIEAGRNDLQDLEGQMAEYGAQFMKKRPGNPTATARALDSAEATSPLQDMARRFGFALNQVLDLTAKWQGLDDGGNAEMATDFSVITADAAMLNALRDLRKAKDISRVAYVEQLKAFGVLSDNYDPEADEEQIEAEAMNLFAVPVMETEDEPEEEADE